jgi:hypothetical protein
MIASLPVSLVDFSINITSSMTKTEINNLSQKYEIRHPHFLGKKETSCSLIVPAKFVDCIGLVKGDYVKLYVDNDRIWMERIAQEPEGEIIDNK